jgi:PPK2 family polyphosphate:nucleotide phosphotransferase
MNRYRVEPGSPVSLDARDCDAPPDLPGGKESALERLDELTRRLGDLQELLYAGRQHRVLVVLQAMDTGGKDGAIRHVFEGVDPQGVRVVSFKAPTLTELDHDYLWRIHQQTPAKGEMVIFNRSHYEDALVVRVHQLVPESVWSRRFAQINDFERMLVEEGTLILKFFLHISPDEQKKRLQDRLADPTKHWKFNPQDLAERKLWPEYMRAYEDVLSKTSTPWAPWYIVPGNRKWYRDLVVATALVEALENLNMRYPQPEYDPSKIVIE